MLIFDEHDKTIILDSIHTPLISEYMYVLDLNIMDFTLSPLLVLEETVAPTIELLIMGFKFTLPASWNILVVDEETLQLDVVGVSELAGRDFRVFLYGPNQSRHEMAIAVVTDFHPNFHNVGPSLSKHQMLCHPVAPNWWINAAPTDSYNKFLKNTVAGDLT